LLVNWPHLLPFTQLTHPSPNSQNPTCPTPTNDDLGNILALGVQNNPDRVLETLIRIVQILIRVIPLQEF
jgi:hypothetical protein